MRLRSHPKKLARLFDVSFSDGLSRLSERVTIPAPRLLTGETFWPTIFAFADNLEKASGDQDLATVAMLFHMSDAPSSAARNDFEQSARKWCVEMVQTGRDLGVLDQELPTGLHVELVWSIAVALDRWLALHAAAAKGGADLTRVLLTRLLGRP